MIDEENRNAINEALIKAREAIDKSFEDKGLDKSYFDFDIKVYFLSNNFEDVLHIIEDKEHHE